MVFYCGAMPTTNRPPPPYGNPVFPVQPRTVARTVGSQNHSTEIGNIRHPFVSFSCPPLCFDQTMPCNVCHPKNAETVAFLSLAESDHCTLRQKHSDCAEDWVICELCVRQARPNPFFGSLSSRFATSTSTTTAAITATDTATSSATTTATRAVPVKPVKPLRKAKKEKTLKTITVDDCDTLCLRVHYPAGEWLDSKICGTQLFFCCL